MNYVSWKEIVMYLEHKLHTIIITQNNYTKLLHKTITQNNLSKMLTFQIITPMNVFSKLLKK